MICDPLVSDKIKIKREMLPEYKLKIGDSYKIPFGNVKQISASHF